MRSFLYQAAHGLGVEMVVIDAAARLANALSSRVVMPVMPLLESTVYLHEVPTLFEIPDGFEWCTTAEFRESGSHIERIVKVLPDHLKEYNDPGLRELHPTWIAVIDRLSYFVRMGFTFGEVIEHRCSAPVDLSAATALFNFHGGSTVGAGFLNRLLAEPPPSDARSFRHLPFAPSVPTKRWRAEAMRQVGRVDLAVHVRRGNLVAAAPLHGFVLPGFEEYEQEIRSKRAQSVYLATDGDDAWRALSSPGVVDRVEGDDLLLRAVLEAAVCCMAKRFVGTMASTFSHLIASGRERLGAALQDTVLL